MASHKDRDNKRWIEEKQKAFYSECATSDSSDLHHWIAYWTGKAKAAHLPPEQAVRYLEAVATGRKGKTPYSTACRDIEATVRNLYAKDSGHIASRYSSGDYQRYSAQNFLPAKESQQDKKARQERNRSQLIAKAGFKDVAESTIIYRSPSRFPENPIAQSRYFLERMFLPDDRVFIAPRLEYGKAPQFVRPIKEVLPELPRYSPGWIESEKAESVPQYFSLCTLTGQPNSAGSLTSADCRIRQDYGMFEFDDISLEEQRCIWLALMEYMPIVAIVYSGNKSYHVLVKLDGETLEDADEEVLTYYRQVFSQLGVDENKKAKGTRARLPGAIRRDDAGAIERWDNGAPRFSRLIYFNERLAVNQVVEVDEVKAVNEVVAVEEIENRSEPEFVCAWF